MAEQPHIFDFSFVDDLLLLPPQNAQDALTTVQPMQAGEIGPLVEYSLQRMFVKGSYPRVSEILICRVAEQLDRVMEKHGRFDLTSTSLDALPSEFAPLPDGSEVAGLMWRAFKNRLVSAAMNAGFDKPTAKGFAGVFGELQDNARDHSNLRHTVITGYRWSADEFEMVVADSGIGVLASLRSHPDYGHLADHGEALRMALSSGETRYGRGSGHGAGFDTVFRNLASLHGFLRFRSGDHSLELNAGSPGLINAKLRQRHHFQGFAVSITCRPTKSS